MNFNSIKVRLELIDAVDTAHQNTNFNSIKVRLELAALIHSTQLAQFQFHKGTIRTFWSSDRGGAERDFNSIKVRLEPNGGATAPPEAQSFQFHKGTIRTLRGRRGLTCDMRFQFHKGTIRTMCDWCTFQILSYFNSIKVRLELSGFGKVGYHNRHFNSIKVRLERWLSIVIQFLASFQFHKGTIRTLTEASLLLVLTDFNSIKVRLEQHITNIC